MRWLCTLLLLLFLKTAIAQESMQARCNQCRLFDTVGKVFKEAYYLHRALFSVDTAKIIAGFVPLFLTTKMIDDRIHGSFYDASCHQNICQFPDAFTRSVEEIAFWGVIGLASFALWAPHAHVRTTSRIFGIGALSGLCFKDVVKTCKTNSNLRPWNEKFSHKQRAYGGLPSGHMFEAAYMAMVFGIEYGKRAWIPLGLFAACMFAVSVNANRHYVSQVVAGTCLGVIYGVATHKAIDRSWNERWCVEPCFEKKCKGVRMSVRF